MEPAHLHDPLRSQYESNTRRFSLRTKIIAVLLVLIFCLIPLYDISPGAFNANYVEVPVDCYPSLNCNGCFGTYPLTFRDLILSL